jgi:hypothetical protein
MRLIGIPAKKAERGDRMKQEDEIAKDSIADNDKSSVKIIREAVPIAEWPEIERKMAIISRMTSDRT